VTAAIVERLPNWRPRLDEYLDGIEGRPFEWLSLNCGFFAADCVIAETGLDFAPEFRGKFTTEKGAALALRRAGFVSVVDVAAARLPEIPPDTARYGDVAAVLVDGRPALVLVNRASLICMSAAGKAALPSDRAYRAFRVG
jgi:hypothetical protein